MRAWALRGYLHGNHELQYPLFITYGELMAKKAEEQIKYPDHTFVIKETVI